MSHGFAHAGDHAFKRWSSDPWPFAVIDLDEAHASQVLHGLADRGASHSIALHQLTLGRETIPRPEIVGLDHRKQTVLDKLRQLWPRDRIAPCQGSVSGFFPSTDQGDKISTATNTAYPSPLAPTKSLRNFRCLSISTLKSSASSVTKRLPIS